VAAGAAPATRDDARLQRRIRLSGPVQRLRALEQDPAGGDELVLALRAIAAVGMGKGGRRDQQVAGAGFDPALLEQEFGLAAFEAVVEIERPQQVAVQGVAIAYARVQLAV